ncbi:hypothetical protein L3081_18595 [Colwellia sp. MSW7]|uniref:Tetratricopeptide repeat protein n=1 Tax=Colwellia maritima TaxID=2912588 RepID=A0ABS9X4B3_9GAMM|nr:hypothetical protein [Colwellia maritima]MCI2285031.1 hypothetical protein [Colwellia maritima]
MNSRKQRKIMSFIGNVVLFLSFFFLPICFAFQSDRSHEDTLFLESRPPEYRQYYEKYLKQGEHDAVLNLMEIGIKALKDKNLVEAAYAFDNALKRIEFVFSDSEAAQKARSLWYSEEEKDFKGEPYERVMAYYYRGLIYLMNGDYENARATFQSGILQDAFAEEQQYRADFSSLILLVGRAASKMGVDHLREDAYQELAKVNPEVAIPKKNHNVIFIAEPGKSPRKLRDGVGHFDLVFRRGKKFKDQSAKVVLNKTEIPLRLADDVFMQASTRGGRAVDRIIKGKVFFKEGSEATGEVLTTVGKTIVGLSAVDSASMNSGAQIGAVLTLVGVGAKIFARNVNAKADKRYWKSLPNTILMSTAYVENLDDLKNIAVLYLDKYDNELSSFDSVTIVKINDNNAIVWSKSNE